MVKSTRGAVALRNVVYPRIRLTDLSEKTGISRQRLRALARGEGEATASEMAKLRDHASIDLEAWTEDAPSGELPPDAVDEDE